MSNNLKTILIGLAFFLLCSVVVYFYGDHKGFVRGKDKGYAVGYENGYAAGYEADHPADTVFVVDTSHHEKPIPTSVVPAGYELAPAGTLADLRAQVDSLSALPDTVEVFVPVQLETKRYGVLSDDGYEAQITGWNTSLDWINIQQRTEVITKYITKRVPYDHTLSLFAEGYASFNYVSARAGLMYESRIHGNLHGFVATGYEYGTLGHSAFLLGGAKMNLINK